MSVVKNKNGRGILLAMVHSIQQNKQLLGDVDGLIGDGDHGMNMNKGFTLYEEQLGDQDTSLSDGLFDLGSVLLNKIGGSMGPIYGTIFMEMSSVIEDVEDITLETFSEMLRSGLDGLYKIVDARPGDKTLWLCQDRHTVFSEFFQLPPKWGALIVLACRYKFKPARSTHIYLNLS